MSGCLNPPAVCCTDSVRSIPVPPPAGSYSFKGPLQGDWKEIRHTTVEYVHVGPNSGDYVKAEATHWLDRIWLLKTVPLGFCLGLISCLIIAASMGLFGAKDSANHSPMEPARDAVNDVNRGFFVAKDASAKDDNIGCVASYFDGEDACAHLLPFVKIDKLVSSNLGEQGPDTNASEGLIFSATSLHTGLKSVSNLEIHVHSLVRFSEPAVQDNYDLNYRPAFVVGNFTDGLHGKFAAINLKPGAVLKLRVHVFDVDEQKAIPIPNAAITFFDFDTGPYSFEYLKMAGFCQYFLTNETQITVSKETVDNETFTVFNATKEATGADNPTDPLELTVLQKDKAVTFELDADTPHIDFEIGATKGQTGRVFQFVLRPSLLCAQTKLHDGTLLPALSPSAPILIVPTLP